IVERRSLMPGFRCLHCAARVPVGLDLGKVLAPPDPRLQHRRGQEGNGDADEEQGDDGNQDHAQTMWMSMIFPITHDPAGPTTAAMTSRTRPVVVWKSGCMYVDDRMVRMTARPTGSSVRIQRDMRP